MTMSEDSGSTLGAAYLGDSRCQFRVWAPLARIAHICILPDGRGANRDSAPRLEPMRSAENGYFEARLDGVVPGTRYYYRLDGGRQFPDPASRYQPEGVHGPSEVVDPEFAWEDEGWLGLPLQEYIIYELHVGTFTGDGTFEAAIPHLADLKDLGVTAVELMPVAQFPGSRNWGYDGVGLFAPQNSYGGPRGLKSLINACHQHGLAAVLDVVYNHLGPEGNYLGQFGHYFTDAYKTPWGLALNFDGPHSDEVRRFFVENALYWLTEFRIDALRLDAIHAIRDHSARTFLEEIADAVHEGAKSLNRRAYVIGESALNDVRIIRSKAAGGIGLDAQWNDDFHHSLHTLLTGERDGYYVDFGRIGDLVKAFGEGYVYSGEYSEYRQRRHGNSSSEAAAFRFVVFAQNHDQVGNRMLGDRLSQAVSLDDLKLAAGAVLLSPFVPLLFMGEEYGEKAPFLYFVSHSDPDLVEAVRAGRKNEFAAFAWKGEGPDPQDPATFRRCKLDHGLRKSGDHAVLLRFYKELIRLRKSLRPLALLSKEHMEVAGSEDDKCVSAHRWSEGQEVFVWFNFGTHPGRATLPASRGRWLLELDSNDRRWRAEPGQDEPPSADGRYCEGGTSIAVGSRSFMLFSKEGRS